MSDEYPIVTVEPEWGRRSDPEEMGTREKFWYSKPDDETNWLFKYPRSNAGEHWAEKIASEVASVMEIMHAKVELAEFGDERGSVTESFARGGRTLYHGNQMLEAIVEGYGLQEKFRESSHSLANIWKVMDSVFVESKVARRAKLVIAEYTVLDALIGNTDRHHENWGILRRRVSDGWRGFVAPSYDHASSLGRELLDERRNLLLTENRVGNYAEKGHGAIYWSEEEQRGPSPLELVRQAAPIYPNLFRPAVLKLTRIDEEAFPQIVDRIPSDWMTSSARMFAIALMRYNYEKLQEIFQ